MYAQIDANKRRTWVLIVLFTMITVGLGAVLGEYIGEPSVGIIFAVMLTVIMNLTAYFKGDSVALAAAGAKEITKEQYRELYLLVENLSITAGIPMPKVYVINDPSPNAFATGRDPEHASIAVTTGLMKIMNKQELEGVVAHELAHVQNYDIRVMTIVVVLVGVVLLLSDILMRTFIFGDRNGNGNSKNALPLLIIGLALAILSPLFAQMIKMAVSRSREYLADASGALLTRYPEGLASALEKIAQHDMPLKKANHATAHLFLANPFDPHVTKKFESMFSTHPPIEERIKKLRGMA